MDASEGAADLGVSGAEDDGGREPEVGSKVGEDSVVGEEDATAGEGLQNGCQICGIRDKRDIRAEALGEFLGFRGGGALPEDDDIEFGIAEELGDFREAVERPAVGGSELGTWGDGDGGDLGAGRKRRCFEIRRDHGLDAEFLDEGHVVTDAMQGRAEGLGEVEWLVELGSEFVAPVAETLLDLQLGEGLGYFGRFPGDGGFELHVCSLQGCRDHFDRGVLGVGDNEIDAQFAFPKRDQGSGSGNGDGGVRSSVTESTNGRCGEACFHGVFGNGDDKVATPEMEGWFVGNGDRLRHVCHAGMLRSSGRAVDVDGGGKVGVVEIWFAGGSCAGGEEALGRVEDEGAVKARGGAETQGFTQVFEGDGDSGVPLFGVVGSGCGDIGDGLFLVGESLPWSGEEAGPPGAVGGEIDLEIGAGFGIAEEEFGNVELPKLGLEEARFSTRMNSECGVASGAKMKMGLVESECITRRIVNNSIKPIPWNLG